MRRAVVRGEGGGAVQVRQATVMQLVNSLLHMLLLLVVVVLLLLTI